jgi:hypothetical protein
MVTPCRLDMQGTDWIDVGEADDVSGRLVLKAWTAMCGGDDAPPLSDGKVGERVTLRGRVSLSFWDRGGEQQKDSSSCLRAL